MGFPVFGVTLAGDSPPAGDLLSCFAKKEGKEGDPASPVGLRPTPLLVRGSKVQTGFYAHRAFTDATSQITGQSHEPLITCISGPL